MHNKKILALDTTTNACSVALKINKKIIENFAITPKEHTKYILPMIDSILKKTKTNLKDINLIILGIGPGNLNGVRINACIAYGLSEINKIPMIGVSTLNSIAQTTWRTKKTKKILILLKHRTQTVYWAKYILKKKYIWVGKKTEKVIKISNIYQELEKLTGTWYYSGNGWSKKTYNICTQNINKNLILKKSNIIYPSAQDLISLIMKKKHLNKIQSSQIKFNYPHNNK